MSNKKRPTTKIMEELNSKIAEQGSCLRFERAFESCGLITYHLVCIDKFIDKKYTNLPTISEEFSKFVKDFLENKGTPYSGFKNTITTIFAIEG